jgi:MFS-type transporter involved in bile tolerance (Atg22 family)
MTTLLIIYVIGFILSLIFLSAFGKKKLNIDYDNAEDKWPDDWDSNAEAYVTWSIAWPLTSLLLIIAGVWVGLTKTAQFLINLFGNDNDDE